MPTSIPIDIKDKETLFRHLDDIVAKLMNIPNQSTDHDDDLAELDDGLARLRDWQEVVVCNQDGFSQDICQFFDSPRDLIEEHDTPDAMKAIYELKDEINRRLAAK